MDDKRGKRLAKITFASTTPPTALDTGFMKLERFQLKNYYDDATVSETYYCDIVGRKNVDAVAVLAYRQTGKNVEVFLKDGFRPPVYYREVVRDGKTNEPSATRYLEVAAGVREAEDGEGDEAVRRCAQRELLEELGFSVEPTQIVILGASVYTSPGALLEKVAITAVDVTGCAPLPAKTDGSPMEEGSAAVKIELFEALALCKTGTINNALTELALFRLRDHVYDGEDRVVSAYQKRFQTLTGELARVIRENEYYNRLVREFRANISHELKHPIAEMMGYLSLLERGTLTEEAKTKALTTITNNAKKLHEIGQNLVNVALNPPIETEENVEFSPEEAINRAIDDHAFSYNASAVTVSVNVEPSCAKLIGSEARFRVIVDALVSNALKFTKKGRVRIRVAPASSLEEGVIDFSPDLFNYHLMKDLTVKAIEFSVSDTGIGIAKKQLPHIFKPFYQGDYGFSRAFGGMGLGLYIAENLTRAMQGRLVIKSDLGAGVRARVHLPFGVVERE